MARIPGFHPGGPGSIPGVGEKLFLLVVLVTDTIYEQEMTKQHHY